MTTYQKITHFESHTGNGGGDPDATASANEKERLGAIGLKLEDARRNGKDISKLTARQVDKWKRLGWYDLFDSR